MTFPDKETLLEQMGSRGQLVWGQGQGVYRGKESLGKGTSQLLGTPRNLHQGVSQDLVSGGLEESWAGGAQASMRRVPCWAVDRMEGSPFWSLSQRVPVLGSWPSGPPLGVGPGLGAAPGAEQPRSSSAGRSHFWGHTGVAGGSGLAAACPQPHASSHLTSSRNLSNSK